MKWLNLLIYIFFTSATYASMEVACSHEEICKMLKLFDPKISTKVLANIQGDPHEFEPSAEEIKNFLSAKILVVGPIELNPWIKKIHYQRSKNQNLKTYSFKISPEIMNFYSTNNLEALSHFWLYPRLYCDFKYQLSTFDFIAANHSKTNCDILEIENELSAKLKKISGAIVLTHDALYPLLKKYTNEKIVIINLKGSNHHEEISPLAIKNIYKIKQQNILWILEKNLVVPDAIKAIIKSTDQKIAIDTARNDSSLEFAVLKSLLKELK